MVFQDIPGDRVGLAAGKACHDGDHVAVYDADVPVSRAGSFVQACSGLCLHDDDFRRVFRIPVGEISLDRPGERADAGLYEYMGRTFASVIVELIVRFHCHGAVPLHDPGRDLLVAVPRGILHHDAVLCLLCHGVCHAHTFIVIVIFDRCLSSLSEDVVQPCLRSALWHEDNRLLSQLVCRPGDSAAVVAVCRGEKGRLAEFLSELFRSEYIIWKLRHVFSGLLRYVTRHGERSAQHFEGIESETIRLILDVNFLQAEALCHAVQLRQGSDAVLGKALVKGARLPDLVKPHDGEIGIFGFRHFVDCPFDRIH